MARIDARAVISPTAQLADDVEVGPFAVIGDNVVIGPRCWIGPHAVVNGPTTLGADNGIGEYEARSGREGHISCTWVLCSEGKAAHPHARVH